MRIDRRSQDGTAADGSPNAPSAGIHRAFCPAFKILLLAGLFASYPAALIFPAGVGPELLFHIGIPLIVAIALTALAYLCVTPVRSRGNGAPRRVAWFYSVLGGYVGLNLLAAFLGGTAQPFRVVMSLAPLVVAGFIAVGPCRFSYRQWARILAVLWLVQIVHCIFQWRVGFEPVALTGNRNWAATLIVVLVPWPILAIQRRIAARRLTDIPVWIGLLYAAVIAVSAVFVYLGHCRATWLALALYAGAAILAWHCNWIGRVVLSAIVVAVLLGALAAYPERVAETLERDIRIPLYLSTLRLVSQHPVVGVGPGNFRKHFVRYRSTAQSARAVAAPVTEHPHNELLNQAAEGGIPSALLWAAVFILPLLLDPGRNPHRRLAHFSLWMLVLHGMLDKVLVQPPTVLLAAIFAGMLWRPRLQPRARPAARPAGLRALRLPLAGVVAIVSLVICAREGWRGVLFRQAYMAEADAQDLQAAGHHERARKRFEQAYEAYRKSTRAAPGDVRTHAYAGISANHKLRRPEIALEHIQDAMALEKDFAHLNGEAGLALGSLNRHEEAFPFFLREAELFPYSIQPIQQLMVCARATNRTQLLPALHDRLMHLSVRRVRQRLGRQTAAELAMLYRHALSRRQAKAALDTANRLTASLDTSAVDAALYSGLDRSIVDALRNSPFNPLDWHYWNQLASLKERLEKTRPGDPADLLPLLRTGSDKPALRAADKARTLIRLGRHCGMQGAYLRTHPAEDSIRFVQLATPETTWIVDVQEETVSAQTTFADLFLQGKIRTPAPGNSQPQHPVKAIIPSHPLQFFYRTQALGALASTSAAPHETPPSFSPLVAAAALRTELIQAAERSPETVPAIAVDYDREVFNDFLDTLRAALEENRDESPNAP